jgi:hypothetical protein
MAMLDVSRGDLVIEAYSVGERDEKLARSTVKSVGPKWITTKRGARYRAEDGGGEFGWRLYTEASYAEARRRKVAMARVSEGTCWAAMRKMPIAKLERLVAVLDEADE